MKYSINNLLSKLFLIYVFFLSVTIFTILIGSVVPRELEIDLFNMHPSEIGIFAYCILLLVILLIPYYIYVFSLLITLLFYIYIFGLKELLREYLIFRKYFKIKLLDEYISDFSNYN